MSSAVGTEPRNLHYMPLSRGFKDRARLFSSYLITDCTPIVPCNGSSEVDLPNLDTRVWFFLIDTISNSTINHFASTESLE